MHKNKLINTAEKNATYRSYRKMVAGATVGDDTAAASTEAAQGVSDQQQQMLMAMQALTMAVQASREGRAGGGGHAEMRNGRKDERQERQEGVRRNEGKSGGKEG